MHPNTPPAPASEKTQKLIVVEQWWMSLAKSEHVRTIRTPKKLTYALSNVKPIITKIPEYYKLQ